jgi:hypothetical protein
MDESWDMDEFDVADYIVGSPKHKRPRRKRGCRN